MSGQRPGSLNFIWYHRSPVRGVRVYSSFALIVLVARLGVEIEMYEFFFGNQNISVLAIVYN